MLAVRRQRSLWYVVTLACLCALRTARASGPELETHPASADPAADSAAARTAKAPCSAQDTPIGAIQGTGDRAALAGTQTVQGVVIGDFEFTGTGSASEQLRGFYLQNAPGTDDADPLSSDAIFVYSGQADLVSLGQIVQVTGDVVEYGFGASGRALTLTEMTNPRIEICGSGASVEPIDLTLPLPSVDFLERYEGMLVRLPQRLFVTEHYQLGRFGQLVLASDGRLRQPTSVADPGPAALAQQAANDLNRILLDDAWQAQNPEPIVFGRAGGELTASNPLRAGDSIAGVVGVLTQSDATSAPNVSASTDPVAYRVRPFQVLHAQKLEFRADNPRPTLPAIGAGAVKVAGVNLLNYFNSFGTGACAYGVGGPVAECRGAANAADFSRQWPKTVAAILGTGANIVVLTELENDGYGPTSAIQDLLDKLNAASAPGTFAFLDVDALTGQVNALGVDAIRVGLLYKPRSARPVGQTAVLNNGAFGVFQTTSGALQRNRPALAQAFEVDGGGRFVVVGNHWKSKGSSCADNREPVGPDPDRRDGQGECNLTRTAAADQLVAWLASDPTGTGERNTLILGDLNAYARETPIARLAAAGFTDLIAHYVGPDAYSYAFDGQWGYLDHALASKSLLEHVQSAVELHISADEPVVLDYNSQYKSARQLASLYAPDAFRSSDHDPVVVGLTFRPSEVPPAVPWAGWHFGVMTLLLATGGLLIARRRPRWGTVMERGSDAR